MLSGVQQVSVVGESGGPVLRLMGRVGAEALSPLLGTTLEGNTVDVELDIDLESHFLLKARVVGPVTPTDVPEVVRVITLSGFNEAVTIEPPK